MTGRAVTVFFSYSHKDEALRDELANHLEILKRNGDITDWHDRKIFPGDEWKQEIKDSLNSAQIVLLLISADFIASDYCYDLEMKQAMARHAAGEACVIPVILRKCMWSSAPFGKLQALPKNAAPVTDAATWPTKDDAFTNIAEGIKKAANDIRQRLIVARQSKLDQYETTYRQAIQRVYPISSVAQSKLNRLQTALNLSDVDISPIVTRLSAQYGQAQQKLAKYRYEVRLCLEEDSGELSAFSRSVLDGFRSTFGLTPEEATAVETKELQKYREKDDAITKYTQVFASALKHENPPGQVSRRRLKRFQDALNLNDEDVAKIESSCVIAGKTTPPIANRKELHECDSSKLLFLKNIRDPNGGWSYTLSHIQEMSGSPESRVFEIYWLPGGKGMNALSKGDLMILNQRAKVTHIVEILDDEVRGTEVGFFRWARIVWMPKLDDWTQLPHQRDVLGFEPSRFGGGTAFYFNSPNFGKFHAAWDSVEAFQKHVFKQLTESDF